VLLLHAPAFNFIHAAAALTHAAQLLASATSTAPPGGSQVQQQKRGQRARQQQQQGSVAATAGLLQVLPLLLQLAQQQCPAFQGRQVANCMWAAYRLLCALQQQTHQQQQQHGPPSQQQQQQHCQHQLLALTQQLLQQADGCWHLFTGQELVLLLYSATHIPAVAGAAAGSSSYVDSTAGLRAQPAWVHAALRQLQRLQQRRLLVLKPQELEMLLTALRRFQQQLLQKQQPQHKAGPAAPAAAAAQQGAPLELPVGLIQQQLVAVTQRQQQWQRGQGRGRGQGSTTPSPQALSPRDGAGLLYALAALGLRPPAGLLTRLLPSFAGKAARRCKAVDVSNTLYALALLRYRPTDEAWWHGLARMWLRQLQQQQQHAQWSAAELVVAVYSLAQLRLRLHARLVAAAAAAAARSLQPQQHGEAAMLLWALGRLKAGVEPATLEALLEVFLQGGVPPQQQQPSHADAAILQRCAQHTSMVWWALGQLGYCPQQQQLHVLLQHSALLLPHTAPRELASLVHGLGCLQFRPYQAWLLGLHQQVLALLVRQQQQQSRAGRSDTSSARQQQRHGSQQQQQQQPTDGFTPQGLAMTFWGLARLGVEPSASVDSNSPQPPPAAAEPAAAAAFRDVAAAGLQVLPALPQAAGIVLWSCVKLGLAAGDTAAAMGDAANASLVALQRAQGLGRAAQQLQRKQQGRQGAQARAQQKQAGRQLAQCVALAFWALAQLAIERRQQQQAVMMVDAEQQHPVQEQQHPVQEQQQQQVQGQPAALLQVLTALTPQVWHLLTCFGISVTVALLSAGAADVPCCLPCCHPNQLQHFNATDLTTLMWSLGQLQLQPPEAWLLRFYGASQAQLPGFTDAQLASLVLALERVLHRSREQQQDTAEQQPLLLLLAVPPAVWQLQVELQLRQRLRERRRQAGDGGTEASLPEPGASQGSSSSDSLAVARRVLVRWRREGGAVAAAVSDGAAK
jgi:hypothetical protein